MNQNETRTLWLSVASALFAVFLLYSYTQEKTDELTKKFGAKVNVVVAKKDINEMETIDEGMLETIEQPVDFIQPGAIKFPDLAVGKVAIAPIQKNEQILESKILKPGPLTGLSLQVSPSKRAITIPVDEMRGVAKLIKPGDRIDIIAALDIGKGVNMRREVKTIMTDVLILATGVKISNELPRLRESVGGKNYITNLREDISFSNVTVEVEPKQAQDLVYILSTSPGSLFMSLRHPSDRSPVRIGSRSTVDSIVGVTARPRTRLPAARIAPRPIKPKKKPKKNGRFRDI